MALLFLIIMFAILVFGITEEVKNYGKFKDVMILAFALVINLAALADLILILNKL